MSRVSPIRAIVASGSLSSVAFAGSRGACAAAPRAHGH